MLGENAFCGDQRISTLSKLPPYHPFQPYLIGEFDPWRRRIMSAFGRKNGLGGRPSFGVARPMRSEEHTSELQSLMRISYAVFCLKKKKVSAYISQQEEKNN